MEPADKPSLIQRWLGLTPDHRAVEFLPDADEIERTPIHHGVPVTFHTLMVMLGVLVLWATFSEIDQVVTARGKLVTPLPNIVIQPIETALVETLSVRMGQVVKKGEILATLDPTFSAADLAQIKDRLESLDAQVRRLEAEKEGLNFKSGKNRDELLQEVLASERLAGYKTRLVRFDENIERLKSAISSNTQDIKNLESRVTSLREIEAMNETLAQKQFQSRRGFLESRDRRLEVETDLQAARNRAQELRRELSGVEAERSGFTKENRQKILEELVSVRRERDAAAEQLLKADRRNRLITLKAPADAVVLEVAKRSPGSIIKEAEPFFTLIPLDAQLEAEVQIDTADIAYVAVDNPVRVKIDAYPFQKHGIISGRLEKLSQDAFAREGGQSGGAYYLGRVELGAVALRNLDHPVRLLPGMSMSAEIVVGKRSVISYLLYPMIRTMDEAAREP
jgi:hemolysin D